MQAWLRAAIQGKQAHDHRGTRPIRNPSHHPPCCSPGAAVAFVDLVRIRHHLVIEACEPVFATPMRAQVSRTRQCSVLTRQRRL